MALSPKKRFSILERDGFTCKYCGGKPPFVQLEVDHIIPKCKGGQDTDENLVSSCSVCNSGKGKNIVGEPDGNSWKKKIEDHIYSEKMKFYDEWNMNRLGIISEKTKVLISIFYSNLYKGNNGDKYKHYLSFCGEGKEEDLDKQFMFGGEFCQNVLDEIKDIQGVNIIEYIADDKKWNGDKMYDKRLNYFLTNYLSDILEKKYVLKKYTLFPDLLENEQ